MILLGLVLMAAPFADHGHVRQPARITRVVHAKRKVKRMRRPISMSVIKPQALGCAGDPICVTGSGPSQYRLVSSQRLEPSDKDMALAEDGTRCALIGQTICPRRGRMILHMGSRAPTIPASAVIK